VQSLLAMLSSGFIGTVIAFIFTAISTALFAAMAYTCFNVKER